MAQGLEPKKTKYRSSFRGRMKGKAQRGSSLAFGEFGLKAMDRGWLASNQIEAARRAIRHHAKRGGILWIRVFPDKPVSKKPPETRMGRGKAPFDHWVVVIKPGRILFEMTGLPEKIAREAMRLASHKLPIKTKFIQKES